MLNYYLLIYKIVYKYINKVIIFDNNQIYFFVDVNRLNDFVFFLKNSLLFKIQSLVDIAAIDWIWRVDRYSIYYNLFSFIYNYRIFLIIDIPIFFNYVYGIGVESLSNLFNSANWLEREVWDLYGIYFYNHIDLRRILTDYGFKGFPFRKDFPLTGFKEIRYDDTYKIIISEDLKMTQEYRAFTFINPWK